MHPNSYRYHKQKKKITHIFAHPLIVFPALGLSLLQSVWELHIRRDPSLQQEQSSYATLGTYLLLPPKDINLYLLDTLRFGELQQSNRYTLHTFGPKVSLSYFIATLSAVAQFYQRGELPLGSYVFALIYKPINWYKIRYACLLYSGTRVQSERKGGNYRPQLSVTQCRISA